LQCTIAVWHIQQMYIVGVKEISYAKFIQSAQNFNQQRNLILSHFCYYICVQKC